VALPSAGWWVAQMGQQRGGLVLDVTGGALMT
jgi:hypothetical protein